MDGLLARLRAVARRGQTTPDVPVVVTGDLTVDLAAHKVLRAGEEVRLTPTEGALLDILVRNRRLVSQRQLLREVWGRQYERETHSLRAYLGHLRRKLECVSRTHNGDQMQGLPQTVPMRRTGDA